MKTETAPIGILKRIRPYLNFRKQEKKAIAWLMAFIILLQSIPHLFAYFFPPSFPVQLRLSEHQLVLSNDTLMIPESQYASPNKSVQKPSRPVEINSADSLELVQLYRIGPGLTSRIIHYRMQLGGFYSLQQLEEIYGFDPDILFDLKDKLRVNPNKRKSIPINTISLERLSEHPYFKIKLSRVIIHYRNEHGPFKSMEELKNIPLVNDSIYQKIKMYIDLTLD